ncbi:hypothetical protein [Psychromarinibacter halotolerans]|uniref:Uncharacterized protein n=1 Tax=Psychromarinibacter halotolerans TaxID=1775175 RepID=A0ABV7GI37_9RHOB|nr:hypothetical protein [Psychromarinibacter halotolerans]MDF0599043.1 hypothetical protein [Psychromarinibacter halotolerans]
MPCDFHPLLLVLGDAAELRHFSNLLSCFAATGARVELTEAGMFSEDTRVMLRELDPEKPERPGLWVREAGTHPVLDWRLTREQAEDFADDVLKTANGESRAGSSTLECEELNEIRVKVSFGEFEDQFLLGNMW